MCVVYLHYNQYSVHNIIHVNHSVPYLFFSLSLCFVTLCGVLSLCVYTCVYVYMCVCLWCAEHQVDTGVP